MLPMSSVKAKKSVLRRSGPRQSEIRKKLRRMLEMRLVFAFAVLALGPVFFRHYASAFYLFTGALFSLTLVYAFLFKWRLDPVLFAHVQIVADVVLVTLLISLTGWGNSEFSFLYFIPIVTTSLFFDRRRSVSVALLGSLLYAAAILLHRYQLSPALRKDGFEVLYSLYIRTIIFCTGGYLCGNLANLLKREKEQLGELKDLHNLILSNMNSGLITTDSANAVIYANRAAEAILGLPLAEMYKRDVGDFFACPAGESPQGDRLTEVLNDALSRQGDAENRKRELQAKAADGGRIPIGFNLSAITNRSGDQVGKVMVFSNLTEVKELERRLRAADKFRAAGELAAGIAHEIRNPLASITGSVEMLAESPGLSGTNRELLSVIMNESARLNGIIEDFLAYARRGNLDMKKEDLCEIMKEAIELLYRGGNLSPDVHIELVTPTDPAIVSADRSQMSQVFLNLLANAVDAVDGNGTISVVMECPMLARSRETDSAYSSSPAARRDSVNDSRPGSANDRYTVSITDTGKGIASEKLSKVFEPFFTTKREGVGIGLCIAERIVREHNGYIDVISEEGKGTSVTVVIPSEQGLCSFTPYAWSPSDLAEKESFPTESGNAGGSRNDVVRSGVRGAEKTTVRIFGL